MSFVKLLKSVATGAAAGVAVVTALPILGPVGAITTTGLIVGSSTGAALGVIDVINENEVEEG